MVSLQQRKAQSLSSSTLSSSKGRHIYWKTSSARYSLSTYLFHLVTKSGLSGVHMGVSNTDIKYHGNQGSSLMMPGQCLGKTCSVLSCELRQDHVLHHHQTTALLHRVHIPDCSLAWSAFVPASPTLRKSQSKRSKIKYIPIWHSLKISKNISDQFVWMSLLEVYCSSKTVLPLSYILMITFCFSFVRSSLV